MRLPLPSVEHPTDRPNFTRVGLGEISIYFSYKTPVAFWSRDRGRYVVRKNDWGPTSGRHLTFIDGGDRDNRIDGDEFERQLGMILDAYINPHIIEELPV